MNFISQSKLLSDSREDSLKNRYVTNDDIMPLLDILKSDFIVLLFVNIVMYILALMDFLLKRYANVTFSILLFPLY